MKSKTIYNVLIVGAGDIGAGYDTPNSNFYLSHAHAFKDHPGFKLIGFVEPNKYNAAIASEKWGVDCFISLDHAFDNFKIDVVSIAVPDEFHYNILKEVIKYKPKFVLAEKPLTQTIPQAIEIVNLYREIPCIVNFKRRFTPEIIALKEKIVNNYFGEFRFGTSYYGKGFIHNGSHLVNLLLYFLDINWDSFEKIDSVLDYKSNDPSLSVLLKSSEKNCSFLIKSLDQNDFTVFDFDMIFSRGKIRITDLGNKIEEYQIEKNDVFNAFLTLELKKSYETKLNKSLIYLIDDIYGFLTQKKPLSCNLDEVYNEMKFTNKIINSIKNG
ncbi:Gfo/Idh/MocA family oxidoreductase [Flavobacteriaceae bacterium]|nr:Gfo/Idh/MocA family oxidoreductase [Flavobacteriaceae bacterium]